MGGNGGDSATNWTIVEQKMPSDYDNMGSMNRFTITAGTGPGASRAQIFQSDFPIVKGETYGLSFYAKAKVGRRVEVSLIKSSSPWTMYVSGIKTIT